MYGLHAQKKIYVWAPFHFLDVFMLHALASFAHVPSKLKRRPFYSLLSFF